MNVTDRGRYTWIISRGIRQPQRTWSIGLLPGVKHTDNVCTSLIQEVLQWRGTPNSSTWTAMGSTGEEDPTCPARDMSTDTWSSTLMGRTTRCSHSTDGSCKTWEDLGKDSTETSTNTMADVHVTGSYTLQTARLVASSTLRRCLPWIWLGVSQLQAKPQHLSFYLTLRQDQIISNLFFDFISR